MKNVTVPTLLDILCNHKQKGAKIVTLLTCTSPKLVKGNPFNNLTRLAYRQVVLGANYEAAVNRQRVKESEDGIGETFKAEALWKGAGQRHSTYTVQHKVKGNIYFYAKPLQHDADNVAGSAAIVKHDEWRDNNAIVEFEAVKPWLPAPYKAKKQEVQHDQLWRTIDLNNVLQVHYGEVYNILH